MPEMTGYAELLLGGPAALHREHQACWLAIKGLCTEILEMCCAVEPIYAPLEMWHVDDGA